MSSQGLLFAEPAIAEIGLWCELADGIDPARWAHLCRYLGNLTPEQFKKVEKRLYDAPDSLKNRLKCLFDFEQAECEGLPFVYLGKLSTEANFGPESDFVLALTTG